MRFLPFGSEAMLIEVDDLDQAVAVRAAVVDAGVRGVHEVVSAARTVLVRFHPGLVDRSRVREIAARAGEASPPPSASGEVVDIPVRYDGADLDEVAALTSLSVAEVVRRHSAPVYRVAFTGFAPGFAYLSGGDPALVVPRRATPRTTIPAGSVAVAGEFSAVYPRASAGGWQLIGRTTATTWMPDAPEPALLRPGHGVRFVPVEALPPVAASPSRVTESTAPPALRVTRVAASALLQDRGRPGAADSGISPGGAMDRDALRRANRLVGNDPAEAVVEIAGGGFELRAEQPVVLAVTGADGAIVRRDRGGRARALPVGEPFALDPGESVGLSAPDAGVYRYLALRGGIAARGELGSRSTDVLSGLGPRPLAAGDALAPRARPIGAVSPGEPGKPSQPGGRLPAVGDVVPVRVVLGPRDDWFTAAGVQTLTGQEWTVTPRSNRVGIRLHGAEPVERRRHDELASEGMVRGAIQVPADGSPVVFAADHPVTGGYPVVATVVADDLDLLAQTPAGARVRFEIVPPPSAGRPERERSPE